MLTEKRHLLTQRRNERDEIQILERIFTLTSLETMLSVNSLILRCVVAFVA